MDASDRDRMGLSRREYPWPEIKDYNPDHQPSHTDWCAVDSADGSTYWLLGIRGLGVLVMCANEFGDDAGVSIVTLAELGYAPRLEGSW
jgi:hypothetical protein